MEKSMIALLFAAWCVALIYQEEKLQKCLAKQKENEKILMQAGRNFITQNSRL
jgi:hypothetical protein